MSEISDILPDELSYDKFDLDIFKNSIHERDGQNSIKNEQLDEMMERIDGLWSCLQCGRSNKDKRDMRSHIEAKHTEGSLYTCSMWKRIRFQERIKNAYV